MAGLFSRLGSVSWTSLPLLGVALALGMILSTWIAADTVLRIKVRDTTIRVKGYAEKPIQADLGQWTAQITVRNRDLSMAHARLVQHRQAVLHYMTLKGFPAAQVGMTAATVNIRHIQNVRGHDTNEIDHYKIDQSFKIESPDVKRIAAAARDSSDLLEVGVEINSHRPQYHYTTLNDLKLTMLEQATANARQRALRLVHGSGAEIGDLRSASQGVFQITPRRSTDVSDYGRNDTTTINKMIKAVVTIEYELD